MAHVFAHDVLYHALTPPLSAIDRLRESRKPTVTSTPPKPKPVTDEQLLAVVEELTQHIAILRESLSNTTAQSGRNARRLRSLRRDGFFNRVLGWWYDDEEGL